MSVIAVYSPHLLVALLIANEQEHGKVFLHNPSYSQGSTYIIEQIKYKDTY